jgi:myo-inositol-1(or 4)-monophosphatase
MKSMDLARLTEVAIGITQEAGALALELYGQVQAMHKGDGTLVTEADRRAEQLIRDRLALHAPDHAIFGEEFDLSGDPDNPYRWYIDPIDGTSNFVFGIPLWGVALGLTFEGRPILGVFDMPASRDLYWAWESGGAYLNGQRLAQPTKVAMHRTDLVTTSSTVLERYDLNFVPKVRCLGSASHALAATAAGSFVAAVHDNWKIHDMAAPLCMCFEAGLVASDDQGNPYPSFAGLDPKAEGPTLVVTAPTLQASVLSSLARQCG